jgi:hypothetical protein
VTGCCEHSNEGGGDLTGRTTISFQGRCSVPLFSRFYSVFLTRRPTVGRVSKNRMFHYRNYSTHFREVGKGDYTESSTAKFVLVRSHQHNPYFIWKSKWTSFFPF